LTDKESGYPDKKGAEPRSGFRSRDLLARHACGKLLDGQPGIRADRRSALMLQVRGAWSNAECVTCTWLLKVFSTNLHLDEVFDIVL